MGRKPTPTKLKILKGNPSKKPLPENEPEPRHIFLKPPNHLCEYAKKEWHSVYPGLSAAGIITEIDKAILAAYCTSYALWERASMVRNELEDGINLEKGLIVNTINGNVIQHPIIGIENRARLDTVKYADYLGMTPSGRTRIQTNVPKKKNKEDKYFT